MKNIIYINISQTLRSNGISGIQRVAKELMIRLDGKVVDDYEFQFGAMVRDRWIPAKAYLNSPEEISGTYTKLKYFRGKASKFLNSRLYLIARRLYRLLGGYYSENIGKELPENSLLVEVDSIWNEYGDYSSKLALRRIYLIYDIIPIVSPQYCDKNQAEIFKRWFDSSLSNARGLISISNTALSETLRYIADNNINDNLISGYFYLGSDISRESHLSSSNVLITNFLEDKKYFISVGTLEPRKNYILLVEAFEKYKIMGGIWSLVIVGRVGGGGTEIVNVIKDSSYFGCELRYFSNADDSDLAALYKGSSCIVTPSLAEGFGLPLVEGAEMGKPIIASNIDVYKELGNEFANFFESKNSGSLVDAMFLVESGNGKILDIKNKSKYLISWDDSAIEFARVVIDAV